MKTIFFSLKLFRVFSSHETMRGSWKEFPTRAILQKCTWTETHDNWYRPGPCFQQQTASQTGLFRIQKSNKIKIVFRSSAKQLVVHIPHIHTKHGIFALCLAELHSLSRHKKMDPCKRCFRSGVVSPPRFCCNRSLSACKRCFRSGVASSARFCCTRSFNSLQALFSVFASAELLLYRQAFLLTMFS